MLHGTTFSTWLGSVVCNSSEAGVAFASSNRSFFSRDEGVSVTVGKAEAEIVCFQAEIENVGAGLEGGRRHGNRLHSQDIARLSWQSEL